MPDRAAAIDFDPPKVSELDLDDVGISTVIWATGYRLNFSWIDLAVFDADGYPMHDRGVTQFPGLHFLGLHWLYTMVSGSLAGVAVDVMHVAHHMPGPTGCRQGYSRSALPTDWKTELDAEGQRSRPPREEAQTRSTSIHPSSTCSSCVAALSVPN